MPGEDCFHYMAAADYSAATWPEAVHLCARQVAISGSTLRDGHRRLASTDRADSHGATEDRRGLRRGHEISGAQGFSHRRYHRHRRSGKDAARSGALVRKLESARAYGRDAARREKFCAEMSERIGIPVHPCSSASEAVARSGHCFYGTTASQPVVRGVDLSPGAHINAIGANHAHKRELDHKRSPARTSLSWIPWNSRARKRAI